MTVGNTLNSHLKMKILRKRVKLIRDLELQALFNTDFIL